ncbi:MAG: beta-ketoacyl-[acyl-carrier-protein] synthase family protein [Gammaproteobacteria bacterium]|nr:beta-ketoacyl-[acyl-carrier-protein] synthase family protein [Gammaproteobacteria bacterium]
MTRAPVYLSSYSLVNALGDSPATIAARLFAGDSSSMVADDASVPGKRVVKGPVSSALPELAGPYVTRTHRLLARAAEALRPALARYGAARVGVVLGTSTSGIAEGELALAEKLRTGAFPAGYDYAMQEMATPARFLAAHLGLAGPVYTVSTACTSSGKALLSARQLLALGLCDAVVTGGADSLCRLTLNGFSALESTSPELCQPFSANRRGINIGEAAGLFLLSRDEAELRLAGIGESADAHHMSAPEPEGRGAEAAMTMALAEAGLQPADIAYVNLHGTATPLNDAMEAKAMARVFGLDTPASSTKPLTGHTLGAASATELGFCALALSAYNAEGRLPPQVFDGVRDPALPAIRLATRDDRLPAGRLALMSNSYAFGGSNISLILCRD